MREVRLLDPQWHEENGRRYYLTLLNWCRRSKGTPASEARTGWEQECYSASLYQLRLYAEWEESLRQSGLRPARDIELALRWDEVSDNSGTGYEVVTKYLQGPSSRASTPLKTP